MAPGGRGKGIRRWTAPSSLRAEEFVGRQCQEDIAHEHGKHRACVQHGREAIERNHLKVVPARVFARLNEFVQRGSTVYLHGFLIGQYVFHEHASMPPDLSVRDRA